MSAKPDGFIFNAKQWLGDDAILLMDWDVRAMHLHLMCIAWQQKNPGTLPFDPLIIRKWLGGVSEIDWDSRIFPQLSKAWIAENGCWTQGGLAREFERQADKSQKRRAAANARWDKIKIIADDEQEDHQAAAAESMAIWRGDSFPVPDESLPGFALLKNLSDCATEFLDKASTEERATIWTIGVGMLVHGTFDEAKARAYLGKLIHSNGEKAVAEAVAKLSLKPLSPADAKAYLAGILRGEHQKKRGRGKVAL